MYKVWLGQTQFMTILSFGLQVWLWPSTKPEKKVSNNIFTSQGEQPCQIILKLIHKCRSYGPDKSRWTDARTHTGTYTELKPAIAAMHGPHSLVRFGN